MSTRPFAEFSLFEEVQFEVSLLNTIQDKRFVLKIRCSSACITGKAFKPFLFPECFLCLNIYEFIHSSNEYLLGFPGGSDDKESACNAGNLGSIRGS